MAEENRRWQVSPRRTGPLKREQRLFVFRHLERRNFVQRGFEKIADGRDDAEHVGLLGGKGQQADIALGKPGAANGLRQLIDRLAGAPAVSHDFPAGAAVSAGSDSRMPLIASSQSSAMLAISGELAA